MLKKISFDLITTIFIASKESSNGNDKMDEFHEEMCEHVEWG